MYSVSSILPETEGKCENVQKMANNREQKNDGAFQACELIK